MTTAKAIVQDATRPTVHELAATAQAGDEGKLAEPKHPIDFTSYKNLPEDMEHPHYHLGQSELFKNLVHPTQASV